MKTLISWLAHTNDFRMQGKDRIVDPLGPTLNFHREHWEAYDQHIILSQEAMDDPRALMLKSAIGKEFPGHKVVLQYMAIEDVIDLAEIKSKVEEFLFKLSARGDEMHIFISPGTAAMQAAFYFWQMTAGRAKRLLQTRRKEEGKPQELVVVKLEKSKVPFMAMLSTERIDLQNASQEFLLPPSIKATYERATLAANAHGVPVMIFGESGTGKERLARTVHERSARAGKAFNAINCAAIPDSLLESILFGYEKGAFTGADERKPGLFEATNGGTIFLDEVGDLSPRMQVALLRVLQESEVLPLSAPKPIKVDVRIVAATHRNLYERCSIGEFRWDLYYRLCVIELALPPLREWSREDRMMLIEHLAARESLAFKAPAPLRFDKPAVDALLNYSFPGNIRELENLIKRLIIFPNDPTRLSDLPDFIQKPRLEASLKWEDAEKSLIQRVLRLTAGNKSQAQKLIGYGSINTLNAKIAEYGIEA